MPAGAAPHYSPEVLVLGEAGRGPEYRGPCIPCCDRRADGRKVLRRWQWQCTQLGKRTPGSRMAGAKALGQDGLREQQAGETEERGPGPGRGEGGVCGRGPDGGVTWDHPSADPRGGPKGRRPAAGEEGLAMAHVGWTSPPAQRRVPKLPHPLPRDPLNLEVLQAFVDCHEFANLNLVQALR